MQRDHDLPKFRKLPNPDLWLDVDLVRWEWEFGLSVSPFEGSDPLAELDSLRVIGTTVSSKKPQLNVEIAFMSAAGFIREKRQNQLIDNVGHLTTVKGGYEGSIGVPADAFAAIRYMLAGDHYRRVELSLIEIARRKYAVQGYYFKHELRASET